MIDIQVKEHERYEQFASGRIFFPFLLNSKLQNLISGTRAIYPRFSITNSILPCEKRLIGNIKNIFQMIPKSLNIEPGMLFLTNFFETETQNFVTRCIISHCEDQFEADFQTTPFLKQILANKVLNIELEVFEFEAYFKQSFQITLEYKLRNNISLSPKEISTALSEFLFLKDENWFFVFEVGQPFELCIDIAYLQDPNLLCFLFGNLESNELNITFRFSEISLVDLKTKQNSVYSEDFFILTKTLLKDILFKPCKNLQVEFKISQSLRNDMSLVKKYERGLFSLCKLIFSLNKNQISQKIFVLLEVKKGPSLKKIISFICAKNKIENGFEWFDLQKEENFSVLLDKLTQSRAFLKIIDHFETAILDQDPSSFSPIAKSKQLSSQLASLKQNPTQPTPSFYFFLTHDFSANFDSKNFDLTQSFQNFPSENLHAFHQQFLSNTTVICEDLLAIKYLFTENDILTVNRAHQGALANSFASELSRQRKASEELDCLSLDEFHQQSYLANLVREDKSERNSVAGSKNFVRRQNSLKIFIKPENYVAHLKARLSTGAKIGTSVEKIPKVHWDDIGGLDEVREELTKILKNNFDQFQKTEPASALSEFDNQRKTKMKKLKTINNFSNNEEFISNVERKLSEIGNAKFFQPKISFDETSPSNINPTSEIDQSQNKYLLEPIKKQSPQKNKPPIQKIPKPRKGVIFFGPPGTGKTLLAKCLANESKSSFISIKGPELLNMFVGESEKNMREVFLRAKNSCPCILFFDELDSLLPRRGSSGDSGNVTDRLVAQFLTELENSPGDLLVIAATNRPDLLDPAILTSGKFDKKIYLGIFNRREQRVNILKSLTREYQLDENVDICEIERICPEFITGADFYLIVVKAVKFAIKRVEVRIENFIEEQGITIERFKTDFRDFKGEFDMKVVLTGEDFRQALFGFKQSVPKSDREKYEKLAKEFADIIVG